MPVSPGHPQEPLASALPASTGAVYEVRVVQMPSDTRSQRPRVLAHAILDKLPSRQPTFTLVGSPGRYAGTWEGEDGTQREASGEVVAGVRMTLLAAQEHLAPEVIEVEVIGQSTTPQADLARGAKIEGNPLVPAQFIAGMGILPTQVGQVEVLHLDASTQVQIVRRTSVETP